MPTSKSVASLLFTLPILRPVFRAGAQRPQIMPVVNPVIVSILPDDCEGVGSYCNDIGDPRGGCIAQLDVEHLCIRFRPHIFMSAAAGGAWTGRAQQLKWIDTRVIIIPCDREFSGLFIGSNAGWFFVHISP
jgi:hypothetical protein